MVKARVFNCVHRIDSVKEGEEWVEKFLDANEQIKFFRAQIEEGENGGLHVQAMFGFMNQRHIGSVQRIIQEPKVQITSEPDVIYFYCTDEEKRYPGTELMQKGDYQVKGNVEDRLKRLKEAENEGNFTKAMQYMEKHCTLYTISNYKSLASYFMRKFPNTDEPEYTLDQFTTPPIDPEILKTQTVVLCGEASYGKTSYAMAHFKRPAVIKTKCDYVKITPATDGVIFDDLDMASWNISTVKNLCNLNITSHQHVKYGHAVLEKGLPRFICVQDEDDFWPKIEDENGIISSKQNLKHYKGIKKRTHIINLEKPLYDTTDEAIDAQINKNPTTWGTPANPSRRGKNFVANDYIRFSPY